MISHLAQEGAISPMVPRLWFFARLPRLGGPSEPGLAPRTAEPLAPYFTNPAPERPGSPTVASP